MAAENTSPGITVTGADCAGLQSGQISAVDRGRHPDPFAVCDTIGKQAPTFPGVILHDDFVRPRCTRASE